MTLEKSKRKSYQAIIFATTFDILFPPLLRQEQFPISSSNWFLIHVLVDIPCSHKRHLLTLSNSWTWNWYNLIKLAICSFLCEKWLHNWPVERIQIHHPKNGIYFGRITLLSGSVPWYFWSDSDAAYKKKCPSLLLEQIFLESLYICRFSSIIYRYIE